MAEIIDMSERRHGKSGSALLPASPEQAVALLTACLALVRPVGMTETETEDWLAVATGEVRHYPIGVLDRACGEARRTCTHHSQIVPAIVAAAKDQTVRECPGWAGIPVVTFDQPRLPPPRLTQADVESMSDNLRKIGLACGALVHDQFGRIVIATDADR